MFIEKFKLGKIHVTYSKKYIEYISLDENNFEIINKTTEDKLYFTCVVDSNRYYYFDRIKKLSKVNFFYIEHKYAIMDLVIIIT